MPSAERLKSKLGPILFQLPPQWKVNPERLDSFLSVLPKRHRYAIEFRNQTWHTGEIYTILRAHNAAFCIYDLAGFQTPLEITADFTYIRLHGPLGKYQGSYPAEALRAWATRIKTWRRMLKHIDILEPASPGFDTRRPSAQRFRPVDRQTARLNSSPTFTSD